MGNGQSMAAVPLGNALRTFFWNPGLAGHHPGPVADHRLNALFLHHCAKNTGRPRNVQTEGAAHIARQAGRSGQLTADHGKQTCRTFIGMIMQNMPARDVRIFLARRVGQGTDTGKAIADICLGKAGAWQ